MIGCFSHFYCFLCLGFCSGGQSDLNKWKGSIFHCSIFLPFLDHHFLLFLCENPTSLPSILYNFHTLTLFCRCSRFQSEIKRLKISSPVRVCQNCYYNLQHERSAEDGTKNWAPSSPAADKRRTSSRGLQTKEYFISPSASFFPKHLPHIPRNPPCPLVRPVTTCTVTHWQCCNRRECRLFLHDSSKAQRRRWPGEKARITDGKKMKKKQTKKKHSVTTLTTCTQHLEEEKRSKNNSDAARLNQSPATARRNKLVYIVNTYHGLFNSTRNKQRTLKTKVNEKKYKLIACNIALWLTTPGFKKKQNKINCV